jgi:UDP-3-O-[3-hydroxymyristoyl] glucosamine N-acyltransferase
MTEGVTISAIADWFRGRKNRLITGSKVNTTQIITAPRNITEADKTHISFIGKKLGASLSKLIQEAQCKLILIEDCLLTEFEKLKLPADAAFVVSKNPKADIVDFCKEFLDFGKPASKTTIHPTASVSPLAKLGKDVTVGPFAVIDEGVTIGNNCTIGPNSVITGQTIIGNNVEVGSCSVIGEPGFGYTRNTPADEYEQFPHYGKVIIGDNVHIGSHNSIARGSLSDTIIEKGVKTDSQVHIAHNVKIGKNTLIMANVMVAGSAVIGSNCWIAPCCCIKNAITIGNNVTAGLQSNITKSIPDNEVIMGNPAMPMKDFSLLHLRDLRQIRENKKK